MSDCISYPLPPGHKYGPDTGDLRWHSGRGSLPEHQALLWWQNMYKSRIRSTLPVTGRYDGPTQAAVAHVQTLSGLPVDGLLGPDEFEAVRTAQRAPRPPPPEIAPEPRQKLRKGRGSTRYRYWRRASKWGVEYGSDPDAPPWYPGRPFGPNERGFHIKEAQLLLGMKPTGIYSAAMTRRVRGMQQLHDLPVSGVIDVNTARIIDPPPWESIDLPHSTRQDPPALEE